MNKRIGYVRVSTDDQNLDLQRDALAQVGCGVIYEEAASGKNATRPELELCRKALRAGDTLVVAFGSTRVQPARPGADRGRAETVRRRFRESDREDRDEQHSW